MNNDQSLARIEPMPSVVDEPRSPQALMRRATDVAGICREIVLKTAVTIQGRKFIRVEGWESIATAHGCFAGAESAEREYDTQGNHIGYKAKGVLRNAHGEIIATGEGFVGFDECDRKGNPTWKNRDEYAGKAMAQTRAISRTCRGVFAHVVVLMDAGLSTTPAEEVPDGGFNDDVRAAKAKPANVPRGTQSPPATPKPAGAATPSATPATATEEQKARWIALLKPLGQAAVTYGWEHGWMLPPSGPDDDQTPGEPLELMSLGHVPTSKRAADTILAEIRDRMDGSASQKPAAEAQSDFERDMDAVEPPGGWQGATQGEPAPDDGVETMVGVLEAITEKHGKSKKGPWTLFGFKVSSNWFNSFNVTLANSAIDFKGHTVKVFFKRNDRGCDLVGIERARQSP